MSFNDYWQAEQKRQEVATAIAALRPGDAAAHERFLKALGQAQLLLPVAELPAGHEAGDMVVGQNVQLKLVLTQGPEGHPYLPVFTSESHLHRNFPVTHPFVVLPFPALAQMALNTQVGGLIIDQNGPATAMLTAPVLQRYVQAAQQGKAPAHQAAPPPLRLGPPPRVVTQREIAALDAYLRQQPDVVLAYLFGVVQPNNQAMLTLGLGVVVPLEPATVQRMAGELGKVLGTVGVLVLDGRLAATLARQPGAIRFDLKLPEESTSKGASPSTADSPPPA